jgi:GYF domain 2
MRQYFIHDGQSEKGPLDIEQLKLETLKKETPIWFDGLENWSTVGEVEELKDLFKATPPPLKKAEPINLTPPKIETQQTISIPQNIVEPVNQKSNTLLYSILGFIVFGGIISWLIYQNKNQSSTLKDVQEKVTQQDQQLTQQQQEQQQKEQAQLQAEQEKQAEKDRVNNVLTEKYMGYRNNWRNFITASHGEFSVGGLGGISDLTINVYNDTDKSIDEVQVQVNYITSGGSVFQTETVSITNIGPNSTKTISAPTSSRGSNVTEEIISITAKSFHFCYPYGMDGNKNLDPYFCK